MSSDTLPLVSHTKSKAAEATQTTSKKGAARKSDLPSVTDTFARLGDIIKMPKNTTMLPSGLLFVDRSAEVNYSINETPCNRCSQSSTKSIFKYVCVSRVPTGYQTTKVVNAYYTCSARGMARECGQDQVRSRDPDRVIMTIKKPKTLSKARQFIPVPVKGPEPRGAIGAARNARPPRNAAPQRIFISPQPQRHQRRTRTSTYPQTKGRRGSGILGKG
jgi:hypothetical protein